MFLMAQSKMDSVNTQFPEACKWTKKKQKEKEKKSVWVIYYQVKNYPQILAA